MIKRFYILLLAIVASVGMSFAQDPGIVSSGTKGGMSYTFYDNGLLEISGSGALPGNAFTNWDGGFGTSVKNIRFAEDCEVYGLDYLWFGCYTENSQLETVEINSVAPIMFSGTSGAGIFYRQDGAVTLTITAPGIVDAENQIIDNYGSPVNMIFNMPATTVFERKWFSGLENNFAVTIPTGAKGHIPAGYSFTDPYDQKDYDDMVAHGHEDLFWESHSHLVEGVNYTNGVESTFVITAENASQIFGQAAVSFQAPTQANNSEWVLWRKSDLKTFSDMSSGDKKVCKDVTVKVNNGVYNTNSGWGIHFESLAEDGVQFVAPEGKVFKRIVILNEYGTFSDPNWSYDKNYKKWSGSANTVGFVGDICGISLIEFELEASAPAAPAYETVMNLINEIGTVELTAECKAKIDAARAAFIALSDGDKDLVTNIATLTTAEAAFDNVMDIWLSGDCDVILWKDTTLTVRKHAGEGNGAMADYTSYYGNNTAPWFNSHWYNPQPGDIVIKSVTIEEGVTHIGENAFGWMSELKTLTIPSSVTSIGEDAFYWSKAVDDIYLSADPSNLTWVQPHSADNQFKAEKATRCHVPADLLTAYQEKFGTLNVTFVGDLDPITPLTPEQQQALDAAKDKIAAIPSPVVYTPACKDAIDAARAAYDALTPDMLKQLVSNYATLTAAETTYANLKDVVVVEAKINAIPQPVTLKLATRDSIESARAAYDALTDDQKLLVSNYGVLTAAEAALAALNPGGSIPVDIVWDGNTGIANVDPNTTSPAYEGMTVTVGNGSSFSTYQSRLYFTFYSQPNGGYIFANENGTNITKVVIESTTALTSTMTEVDRMGSGWVISNENKTATWTGNADSVSIWKGQSFTNYWVVDKITFTVNGVGATPLDSAQVVKDLIDAIPAEITLEDVCVNAVQAARDAYNALSDATKGALDDATVQKLNQAIADYTALIQAGADEVIAKINNIPQPVTLKLATRDSINNARVAYDALTADQQALVSNYDVLTDAEAALAALNPGGSASVDVVWDINTGIANVNPNATSPAYEGITITTGNGNRFYQTTQDPIMLRFFFTGGKGSYAFAKEDGTHFTKVALISSVEMSSWLLDPSRIGTDWVVSDENKKATWIGDADTVKIWDGAGATSWVDVDSIVFTVNGTSTPLDSAQAVKDQIEAIPAEITLDAACVNAVQAARDAYDALSEATQGALDAATVQKLTDAEAALTALNQAVADEVIAKINNIPTPVELKLATRDSIQNARTAYDALNAAQQALVSNHQILLDAEAALAALNPGVPPATPLDSAQAVKDLIDAIPTPVEYPTSGAAIEAALNAFNELSDAAKGALDAADVQKLNDAAAQYAALEAIAAIEAIPAEIVYDPAVKAAIETAREKYDALSDASKALVNTEILHKLTNAEEAWAILVAKVEHNVSYIGKDGELKHETIALLHIPDPAPEFNGYEFVRWDVKAGDFLEEGLRIKAVYTPIITTNPAAYDSLMYNGTAQTLITAGVAKEGHIEYRINDGEWSAELPQATFAAAYVVYYKLVREGHADYIADPINVTIAKAPVTYTAPTAVENLIYTASNQTLIAAGQTNDGTFEYSLDPTLLDSWKTALPQAKDAGTYSVYYRVQGDLNHLDSTAVDLIAVTIAKAELTATADDKNVIYGDAVPAYTVTYAGWQGDDDASVLTGDLAFACEYASTSNVGEYTITPSGVDAANYTITFVNGKVTVAKAESGCIAPVVYDTLVYNGANQTLIIAGQPMGGEMQYSLDTTVLDCWSTSLPQAKNVGTYNVYYRVKGDMNHNDHYYDLIAVSIAKAALTATAEDKTVTYGDAAPEYTVVYAGWHGTDDASVLTGAIVYACDYLPTSNVGKYTITPSGVDAANYAIQFINGKVTVNKADLMITADDKNVIYGEVAPAFTASYSGWKNSDDESVVSGLTLTSEYLVTSNVGTYDIVPANASAMNYAISYTNGTLTVNQAALTITANDTVMIYGDEHPEFTASYSGWKNNDDESVVSGLQFSTPYAPGSYIGTYAINPNSATALNYAITFVDGTLTVNKAHVYVSDAEAQIAKFADGHANAVVLEQGVLNGIKLNDPIAHVTTAAFSSADVAEHLTITLFYELTGDAALLNNYHLDPTSDIFTNEGVIIEPFIPDNEEKPEDEEAKVNEGIEIYAYGYCDGSGYSLKYHLESGNPDQYKIDFADSRFTDVDWTNLVITGKDGTIDIEIPVDLPTGDYTMTVYFRDSRFDWLESRQFNVTFHVNLPETYVRPLFDNVIALVDTCHCLTDIQWYWRANSTELWQPIEGANGYYYHVDGKLTGEYFVYAKMNGEPTYTCGQTDMETLYGETQKASAPVVKAYPNPVVTTTTVTIENSTEWIHNIRIVNLMGAEVMNDTFEGDKTSVEMGNYPQGNYMISVDGIVVKVMKK